ncbi:MAG: hypothetical protein HY842_04730 [Bacteroidetes bacterium]|nr:hypothetical protein [Bacteroidota bacterium]
MKNRHLSPVPSATLNVQHESRRLLACTVRVFGLHRLDLAMQVVEKTFEEAAAQAWFRIPPDPPAFHLALAKQKTHDAIRQQGLSGRLSKEVSLAVEGGHNMEEVLQKIFSETEVGHSRLALLFACCHPALPLRLRMALLLRTMYTFSEKDIQHFRHSDDLALLKELETAPDLLLQNGVLVNVPSPRNFPPRFEALLETVWHLFFEGFDHSEKTVFARRAICDAAFRLGSSLLEHPATDLPPTYALMSVLCMFSARFDVRRGRPSSFLFLDEKNRAKWNPALIDRGVAYYEKAGETDRNSEYHLLAQVLMEHTLAPHPRFTNWNRILDLYNILLHVRPTYHNHLCYAWSLAKNQQPSAAIQHLFSVPTFSGHLLEDWQTNALLGDFYRQAKNLREAISFYRSALQKAPTAALQRMLQKKILSLETGKMKKKKRKF